VIAGNPVTSALRGVALAVLVLVLPLAPRALDAQAIPEPCRTMEARREWVDSIFGALDGARVEVDSTVGEGSTFSVFLPVEGK